MSKACLLPLGLAQRLTLESGTLLTLPCSVGRLGWCSRAHKVGSKPLPIEHRSGPSEWKPSLTSHQGVPSTLLIILFGSHTELWAPPLPSHNAPST